MKPQVLQVRNVTIGTVAWQSKNKDHTGENTIVSVTNGWINKIGKPHFSKVCVSSFLSGLIPSRFYGSRWNLFVVSINGRESAREPHRKEETHNLLKIVQILSHSLVTETIIFPPYKTFYFERFVSNIQCRWFQAWVTCGETICLRKNTDILLSLNCLYIFFLCWTFIVG